ncbi:hypothetical protein GCM10010321_46650 [Streptomyces chartreusis]|nr:TldD/PmbA family protein [Streptomyces chartreusis]GGX26698.1 hypothetical protein GCM10010321_46650 [Streptomyces chartreusis]
MGYETLLDPDLLAIAFRERGSLRADFVEIYAERSAASAMTMKDGRIFDATSGRERGAGVRARLGPTTGFSHTSTLSPTAVLRTVREATASPAPGRVPGADATDAADGTTDPRETDDAGNRSRHAELLHSVSDLAAAETGKIVSVSAVLRSERRTSQVANSGGVHVSGDTARERLAVTVVVGAQSAPVSGRASLGLNTPAARLTEEHVRSTVAEAVRRAHARESAAPAPVGEMPVVLAPGTGAVLIHEACGHGLEADHLTRRSSVFHDMLGKRVGPPGMWLVDDASLSGAWGSFAFDDEGHDGRRTVLIEDGILVDFLWDEVHSLGRDGAAPANGRRQNYQCLPMPRMSNLLVPAGDTAPQDVIADTAHGIYVARLGSGRVNTATGDFVFAAKEAYVIDRGRLGEAIADCSLIGNGPEVLRGIDAIGTDFALGPPGTCGKDGQTLPVGYGQPTLRVRQGLRVGGTAR